MKKIKLLFTFMVVFVTIGFNSCEKEKNFYEKLDAEKYSNLASLVNDELEYIAHSLRINNETFESQGNVILGAKQIYAETPKKYNAFLEGLFHTTKYDKLKTHNKNPAVNRVIDDIEIALINSKNGSGFRDFLKFKFEKVNNSNISNEDKDFLLQYIILYKTSIDFISNNQDVISGNNSLIKGDKEVDDDDDDEKEGWWDSWGRCAAGTVGGAGLGALAGAAAGSVVPIIGTKIGLIAGGISGGLSGAAASC